MYLSFIKEFYKQMEYDEGGILEEITEKIKNQKEESKLTYNEKDGSYQSDAYGNIRSMKWSSTGFEMNYEYDNLNRMTSVITPDRKKVDYSYNMNNQVVTLSGIIEEKISYSNAKISEYTLLNGIKKLFEYNDLGLTSSLKYNKDESIKTGFSYTYDDNFNIETRTSLDTEKLSSFEYDAANRLTNSYMEGEFESKTAEQLTTSNFSYINRDLVGTKQELVKYEDLPEIIFDTSARSYVYKFSGTKEIRAIELYPKSKVHRVRERDVHIYVKQSSEDAWKEVRNWKFNKDEKNGKLSFVFKEAVRAGYVKVRSVWDDRNVDNKSIDDYSTFKGKPNNLLRIWTLENTLAEEYSYDGNSNRISLAENGSGFSYEYYKNTQGGNTAKVKYDGKWYYTYDENGNRTSRAKALISGVADKNKEYWTYEWDLWNRLVKVVQYNAPDNGECVEVSYEYDALNHRISRTTDSETTKYAYGRNGALAYQEKTVDGNVTKRSFAYLNNEIIGFTDKTGEEESVYYTVTDIQGSITEVYDGSSNLVWKSGYTAFGEIAGEVVDLIDFDGMYTGCDYDSATGLTYHWNRWRSEDGSCFISEDPIRDGMNWYGYAGPNPMVYVDPDGKASILQRTINDNQTNKAYHYAHVIGANTGLRFVLHGLVDRDELGEFSKKNSVWQYSGSKSGFTTNDAGSKTDKYIIRYSGMDDPLTEKAVNTVLQSERFGSGDNEQAKRKYSIFKNDCNAFTREVLKEYKNEWKKEYRNNNPEATRKEINKAWNQHNKEIKADRGKIYNASTGIIE